MAVKCQARLAMIGENVTLRFRDSTIRFCRERFCEFLDDLRDELYEPFAVCVDIGCQTRKGTLELLAKFRFGFPPGSGQMGVVDIKVDRVNRRSCQLIA